MVRYFYAWIPAVFVGALFILSLPWLGLIALVVALAAVAPLALGIVYAPYELGRAIGRRRHGRRGASPRPTTETDVYRHPHAYAARQRIDYRTPEPARSAIRAEAPGQRTLGKEHAS